MVSFTYQNLSVFILVILKSMIKFVILLVSKLKVKMPILKKSFSN